MDHVGISRDELGGFVQKGDMIDCPRCGGQHEVMLGTDQDGNESDLLQFFKCGDSSYLCGIEGELLKGYW